MKHISEYFLERAIQLEKDAQSLCKEHAQGTMKLANLFGTISSGRKEVKLAELDQADCHASPNDGCKHCEAIYDSLMEEEGDDMDDNSIEEAEEKEEIDNEITE